MANEIQTAPSTTLADNDDWQQELNLRELSMKGYDGISLTEWAAGDTDRPEIAAGSVIEIDGAIAKFTNQTAITDEVGIADGWCYIKFVVSGADVTPTLTNTFGTWDTAKQGFYTSGARFAMFAMYRSGAVTKIYTFKSFIAMQNGIMIQTPIQTDLNAHGHISYDSDIWAGEKIKIKIFSGTWTDGNASVNVTHGISNAFTNNRVVMAYATAPYINLIFSGEPPAFGGAADNYTPQAVTVWDTYAVVYRHGTSGDRPFRVFIWYV